MPVNIFVNIFYLFYGRFKCNKKNFKARIMVPRKQGLIVNISSFGGVRYLFNVAYGVGKAAVDRMAVDCGIELKKHNVTVSRLIQVNLV
jgi:NAD(P)-dependent dehydrogenase (short-subunit alcohol dehydrogenase family)